MKQKKTQIIFYFFLLIILSFSTHAKVVYSPGFFTGLDQSRDRFGEMSRPMDSDRYPPILIEKKPKCPRKPLNDDDKPSSDDDRLERDCWAARDQCVNGCLRAISRKNSDAETKRRERKCYADCEANYKSCMGW